MKFKQFYTEDERDFFSKMRIIVLCPMMSPEPRWLQCLTNMVAFSWMNGLPVMWMNVMENQVIHWARNNLAKHALEHGFEYTGEQFTHFLWLDSDHVFNPDLACELAKRMCHNDDIMDMVSALYYSKQARILPVAYVKDKDPDPYKHYQLVKLEEGLVEVDAVGFGAILTKRKCFEVIEYPWFGFIDSSVGEDIYYCVHARKAGLRIFLTGDYRLGHIGTAPIITVHDHKKWLAENEDELGPMTKMALGGQEVSEDERGPVPQSAAD